jgi:hypothetical protein
VECSLFWSIENSRWQIRTRTGCHKSEMEGMAFFGQAGNVGGRQEQHELMIADEAHEVLPDAENLACPSCLRSVALVIMIHTCASYTVHSRHGSC